MTNRVLIVGGSPEAAPANLLRELAAACRFVVAADHGADALCAAGIVPDVLVGDRDSVSAATLEALLGVESVYRPPEKDETDLTLALMEAERLLASGGGEVVVTSVSGGRLDHQLGVIGALTAFSHLRPRISEQGFDAWLLDAQHRRGWHAGAGREGRTVSVISLSDPAIVSERGMKWELESEPLGLLGDRGVSNVIVRDDASVEVERGRALVIVPKRV